MKRNYEKLQKEQLINLLISSRLEIEKLNQSDTQVKIIKKLAKRIKRAIAFIDFYTCNRKYIIENDKEILRILEEGKSYIDIKRK